ncbi:hypothetical protein [Bifidobacterium moukalabense]|uniref:hypothetical protein n=1 Tax=Bifidobacterium moukalabense TaxID=1333651 RepID=UPI0010FA3475|nr:hypothetical protein [Bifidobacterium moukalabense]
MLNVNDIPEEYVRYIALLMSEFFEMVARDEKAVIDHTNGYPDVYSTLREYVAEHVDNSVDVDPDVWSQFPDQPNLAAETRKVYHEGGLDGWQFDAAARMLTFDAIARSLNPDREGGE